MKFLFLIICLLVGQECLQAQYILNGNAAQDATCNCYKLTNAVNTQSGSIWNINQQNLNNSFDFKFDIYLGTNDANGADGIAFILQPVSTSLGSSGGGLGYQGINPSVGVLIDTWQNTDVGDPNYDYISIQKNGNVNHNLMQDLAVPVQASATNINIEDGAYHVLRIQWNEPTKRLTIYFDGVVRQSIIVDMVATIFGGNPMVFWGFTAATGGANNLQKVCTLLNPNFSFTGGGTNFCLGTPIQFNESSDAFAPIVSWIWNFGDGTTFNGQNPPPKIYAATGDYTVSLTVTGLDGCTSTPFSQTVKIGKAPTSTLTAPIASCFGQNVQFNDNSNLNNSGPTNNWLWQFSDGATSNLQNPIKTFAAAGNYTFKFSANNLFNCMGDTAYGSITINPTPTVNFTPFIKQCEKDTMLYNGNVQFNAPAPFLYNWTFSNGGTYTSSSSPDGYNYFATAGNYTGTLIATNSFGCKDSITKPIIIKSKPSYNLIPFKACQNSSITLNANASIPLPDTISFANNGWIVNYPLPSSNTIYIGPTPTIAFTQPGVYWVYAAIGSSNGCDIFDSTTITIASKPIAGAIILQKDTLCSGSNLKIVNASTDPFSSISNIDVFYNSITNPTVFTSFTTPTVGQIFQNTTSTFSSPIIKNDAIKLIATENINGCKDTLQIPYTLHAIPNLTQPDTLKTCKTALPITIETPAVNNIFSGNFILNGLGISGSIFNPSLTTVGYSNISMLYTTQAGCTSSVTKTVEVQAPLSIYAGADVNILSGGFAPFNASASGTYIFGAKYLWSPISTLQNATTLKPICTPTQNQTYTITATTNGGCVSKDSLIVKIVFDIEIPNTFTPNGDGVNDIWEIKYLNTQPFATIQVFNRYGQLVYNGNASAAPFNGKFKNQDLPVGTYYYIIKSSRAAPYKGYVTIIR
jgi:gliding motility-associated-like protein